jgi:uncharacterized protein YcnI
MSRITRAMTTLGIAAVVLSWAAPALGHVTVDPDSAAKGAFTKLTFRVPNEREAGTTEVEVAFPTDHPIPFVSVKPEPGWTYTVDKAKLDNPIDAEGESITEAVSRITWTGGPIKAGEFFEFEVSAGPFPKDVGQLEFKALQTYEDGEVVRWIDPTPESGEEPEHPAPTLKLTSATDDHHGAEEATQADVTKDDVDTAQRVAVIALVVGAAGFLVAVLSAFRRRRMPTT